MRKIVPELSSKFHLSGSSDIQYLGNEQFPELVGWLVGWLVGCFRFNSPLRQYFSLYRAISQREGERGEKG